MPDELGLTTEQDLIDRQNKLNKIVIDLYENPGEYSIYNMQMALVALLEHEANQYKDKENFKDTYILWSVRAKRAKEILSGEAVKSIDFYLALADYVDHNAYYKCLCNMCNVSFYAIYENEDCPVCSSADVKVLEKIR